MSLAFSMPPIRCCRPAVPGMAQGRASVSGSRLYGRKTSLPAASVALGARGEVRVDRRDRGQVRHRPRLGAVGDVAVGQHEHRRPVLDRDPDRLDRDVEAVGRRLSGQHRHRRLTVAAVHHLQQVGLLGLGRHARAGAGALDVADHQRQLGHHRQADGLGLQRDTRTRGGGHAQVTGEAGAQRGADAGDLVLGLEGGDAEPLVLAQLVQHVGGRGDRVGAQEHRQVGLARPGHQAVRQRDVARDLPVRAGRHRGRRHLVRHREHLGGLAEGVPGLERGDVGVPDVRLAGELGGRGT